MKKQYVPLALLLLCLLTMVGCATGPYNMYGIKMQGRSDLDHFKITPKPEGRFQFSHSRSSDKDVYAYARWDSRAWSFDVYVYNDSRSPISTNYFGDEFSLVTTDGTRYELEKGSITAYPDNVINPNTYEVYHLYPPSPIRDLHKSSISYVRCSLGAGFRKTTIYMKQIPGRE